MPDGVAQAPTTMRLSNKGRQFVFDHEAQHGVSHRLHHPSSASGVTIGAGYDMKKRSRAHVAADLASVGVDRAMASAAAEGAGLSGKDADTFVTNNRDLLNLSVDKQVMLLRLITPRYEGPVQRDVKIPLHQHEFDALVSFSYNSGGGWKKVIALINQNKPKHAMVQLSKYV